MKHSACKKDESLQPKTKLLKGWTEVSKLLVAASVAWLLMAWDVDAYRWYPNQSQVDIKPVFSQKYNDISEFELTKILESWVWVYYDWPNDYLNDIKDYHDLKRYQQGLVRKYIGIWKANNITTQKKATLGNRLIAYFKQLNDVSLIINDNRMNSSYFKFEEVRKNWLSMIWIRIEDIIPEFWVNFTTVWREIDEKFYRILEDEKMNSRNTRQNIWSFTYRRQFGENKNSILNLIERIEREF